MGSSLEDEYNKLPNFTKDWGVYKREITLTINATFYNLYLFVSQSYFISICCTSPFLTRITYGIHLPYHYMYICSSNTINLKFTLFFLELCWLYGCPGFYFIPLMRSTSCFCSPNRIVKWSTDCTQ